MLFAGCSANSNQSGAEEAPVDVSSEITETTEMPTEPIVTLTKETTAPPTTATTVEVETAPTTVTGTGYVAATDYRTFEGTGLDGEAGSAHNAKPVSNEDLYVTVAEVGVMPGYTLDWTGMSPWSSIYITDAYGNSYVYDRDNGSGTAVNQATGQEYKFDVVTGGGLIDGFVFYNFPQSDYYTITVNGSAAVTGSDYPLTWSGFTIYK